MIAHHFKLLVLLLPLLIARSVLPIGFMLSFDGGAPRIVVCPAQNAIPSAAANHGAHQAHPAHPGVEHHSVDQSDAHSAEHSHQICPFALGAAAPLAFASVFAPEPSSSEAIAGAPNPGILAVAFHAQPIRGPPALS